MCRFPRDYPVTCLGLKLIDGANLDVLDMRKISKRLHEACEQFASVGEVCAFQIIQLCQDALQEYNSPRQVEPELSLWEEMKLREEFDDSAVSVPEQNIQFEYASLDLFGEASTSWTMRKQSSRKEDVTRPSTSYEPQLQIKGEAVPEENSSGTDHVGNLETLREKDTEKSSFSFIRSVSVSSLRVLLPDIVRQLIDKSFRGGATSKLSLPGKDFAGTGSLDGERMSNIQRDMLIGRLVFPYSSHDLSFSRLLDQLNGMGIIPLWLKSLLKNDPKMFQTACARIFDAQDLACLSYGGDRVDPPEQSPTFWKDIVTFKDPKEQNHVLQMRKNSNEVGQLGYQPSSRYQSDFKEVKVLGKGGYGVVYLALHKFDGRSYAVKKVSLSNQTSGEFERIMREVQTLSRMHHHHVVRYFAAWMETVSANTVSSDLGSSDDDFRFDADVSETDSEDPTFDTTKDSQFDDGIDFVDNSASQKEDVNFDISTSNEPAADAYDSGRMRKFLYIQMEYCHSTLRQLMDNGALRDDESKWKIVRQLLSGLIYIHSKGIIHRDLKPPNIFVDAAGDVKLGDFGLAKFLSSKEYKFESSSGGKEKASHLASVDGTTGVCGTSFYIAPEIEAEEEGRYNEKVDIFSTGIIIFELWNRFSTEMERIVTLRDIRESGKLPKSFENENDRRVSTLVSWLLSRNPSDRPTAQEALRSELIPTTVGDEQLTDLLRSLPENPTARDRMIGALFHLQSANSHTETSKYLNIVPCEETEQKDKIVAILGEAFQRHGGIPMQSACINRASNHSATSSSIITMTPGGAFVSLRHDLRHNFVDWATNCMLRDEECNFQEGFRRYEISTVYRKLKGQEVPREFSQADFDILLPLATSIGDSSSVPVGEAEVISAVNYAMDRVILDTWELRIGHSSIFSSIMSRFDLPKDMRGPVYRLLHMATSNSSPSQSSFRQNKWATLSAELSNMGVPKESLSKIKEIFVQCTGDLQSSLHRLSVLVTPKKKTQAKAAAQRWIDDISSLTSLIRALGVRPNKIFLDPFISPQQEYFSGMLFEFHAVDETTGSTTLIAAGGRFDALIKESWVRSSVLFGSPSTNQPLIGGVGVTISIDRLHQAHIIPKSHPLHLQRYLCVQKEVAHMVRLARSQKGRIQGSKKKLKYFKSFERLE